MRLSIETGVLKTLTHRERIRMIKDAGFDAVDFSFFRLSGENADILGDGYIGYARELKEYMNSLGIACAQAHAPFEMTADDPISLVCPKYVRLTRSIEAAAILGAPYIVVHSIKTAAEDFAEHNRRFYLSLLPYAERAGIKIAIENLFGPLNEQGVRVGYLSDPQEHIEFVRSLGSPYFNICLDLGHSAVTGHKPEDVIRAMDPELFELMHLHDNDYVDDMHRIPFSGKFDWDAICAALRDIGYRGDLSLELICHFNRTPSELHGATLAYAEKIGRRLISMCRD